MSIRQLNLATRPFRNERLPSLLIALGFVLVGAVTLKHAVVAHRLLPSRTSGLARQVQDLEDERGRLADEASRLRGPRAEPAAVAQWAALTALVDRRAFSWSRLFGVLEDVLPPGVRLTAIQPKIERDRSIVVDLTMLTRTNEDALLMIRTLQERPEFENVLPESRDTHEAVETFHVSMNYRPDRAPSPSPSPSPEPSTSPAPSPSPSAAGSPAPSAGPALQ